MGLHHVFIPALLVVVSMLLQTSTVEAGESYELVKDEGQMAKSRGLHKRWKTYNEACPIIP